MDVQFLLCTVPPAGIGNSEGRVQEHVVMPGRELSASGGAAAGHRADRDTDRLAGEEWITTQEAAGLLNVTPTMVNKYARRGKLTRKLRGQRRGRSRSYFRRSEVEALAERRAAWEKGQTEPSEWTGGWEEYDLAPVRRRGPTVLSERNYGEFYTTRQAALLLGVCSQAVHSLRERGMLQGYHKKRQRKWRIPGKVPDDRYNNQWWFYRKEDVHALMQEPEYRKRHARWQQSRTPEDWKWEMGP
jgi:hypothetical protein